MKKKYHYTKKTGRPTKFNAQLVKKAEQYLIDYKKDEAIPTIEGLALYLEIPRQKVYEYAEKFAEFRDIVEMVKTLQAKRLLTGGLLNKFNAVITRLMLAKHGYKESQAVEQTGEFKISWEK